MNTKDEEILALHRKLAAETLRADQGWQRYEEANRDRNSLRAGMVAAGAKPSAFPERDQSHPAEQQGVFRKFDVSRVDGSDAPGGRHHGCRYFVLDMDHDQHAGAALSAYATSCAITHPTLSAELAAEFGKPFVKCEECDGKGFVVTGEGYPGDGFMQPPDGPSVEACPVCEGKGLHNLEKIVNPDCDRDSALFSAIRDGVPLEEPVSVAKAMMAQVKASACLDKDIGPLAMVQLVNIQVQPWTHTKETATAYADGFNRGVEWLRAAIIEYADKINKENGK